MDENYFRFQRRLLKIVGLDIFSLEKFFASRIVVVVVSFCVLVTVQAILVFCAANMDDINAVTDSLTPCFEAILTAVKYALIVGNRKRLVELVLRVRRMAERVDSESECLILQKENARDQSFGKLYFGMFFATGVIAVAVPFVKMLYLYLTTGELELIMPYIALYPFDTSKLPYYLFVCITSIIGSFSVVIATCATESLFWAFVFNLSGHFQILCQRVTNSFNSTEAVALNEIERIVAYHNEILDFYREFNAICQPIVFGQFLISSIELCFLAFRMAEYITDTKSLYIISLLLSVMTQIFTYCYGGEMLRTESDKVSKSIFYSRWYDHSAKVGRNLVLPLMVAGRQCNALGYFFVADMSTMTWIIKTAGSCVTLLRSVNT